MTKLNERMTKFLDSKHFRRIVLSAFSPLFCFWMFFRAFDGNYTGMDILWGTIVTVALCVAVYLYFAIGRKVETGSGIWIIGVLTAFFLVLGGFVMSNPDLESVSYRAWGEYIMFFGWMMPVSHYASRNWEEKRKWSLFKGPARWNKAES